MTRDELATIRQLFIERLNSMCIASFMYSIKIDDHGDGYGIVTATNAADGIIKAFYDAERPDPFVEWELLFPPSNEV